MKSSEVLIIEDDADVREMLCTMLEIRGWSTATAPDGKAGLERLRTQCPDLILCDIMMPDVDGFAVHDSVRADSRLSGLPFVFVSAVMDSRLSGRLSTPHCSFVRKPFTLAQLEDAIRVAQERV